MRLFDRRRRDLWLLLWIASLAAQMAAADLQQLAQQMRHDLEARVIPYWYDSTYKASVPGYVLDDPAQGKADERMVVSQARLLWAYSMLHRKGYRAEGRDLLAAARHGFEFLKGGMRDAEQGGYYWMVDARGKVLNGRKHVYGQAFVIYALAEYFRAAADPEARELAMDLYRCLQDKAHDGAHAGWHEDFQRDWTPMQDPSADTLVDTVGLKSANTHLHVMEALAELADISRSPRVLASLAEALDINQRHCYPAPDAARFTFADTWQPTGRTGISLGHNVEYAWLMLRAEAVAGRSLSWPEFELFLDHTVERSDRTLGGLGESNGDKVWWAQAEFIAALTDGLQHRPEHRAWRFALEKALQFAAGTMANPATGVWYERVASDGTVLSANLATAWKADYHDLRAMTKFIEAFDPHPARP